MPLTLNELAGFLPLGPHYYPPRRDGVQIIQRGPHGMRLAADPVKTREGKERGSGFRFWHEQLNIPANEEWNPPQEIVGLLGLGQVGAGNYFKLFLANLKRYGVPANELCELANTRQPTFSRMAKEVFPPLGDSINSGIREATAMVQSVARSDTGAISKISAFICLLREGNSFHKWEDAEDRTRARASIGALHNLLIIKAGKTDIEGKPRISPTAVDYETGRPKIDRAGEYTAYHLPGAIVERGEEMASGNLCTREMVRSPVIGSLVCEGVGEPRWAFKNPLLTAALVVGGGIAVYALASGFGKGLAKKLV